MEGVAVFACGGQHLIVYLDLCAVGGDEGVGEDGGGFGEERFGLFETCADVGEEELTGIGFEG